MDFTRNISFLVFAFFIVFCFSSSVQSNSSFSGFPFINSASPDLFHSIRVDSQIREDFEDFFHGRIILSKGCEASLPIDFDIIDIIKSELERECPGTVPCADLLVLAARESVVMAGGPFSLLNAREEGNISYPEVVTYELPQDDLSRTMRIFASKCFYETETTADSGAHNNTMFHCKFFRNLLKNFRGHFRDPSLDIRFLDILRAKCNINNTTVSAALFPSTISPWINARTSFHVSLSSVRLDMVYEGPGRVSGTHHYRNLKEEDHASKKAGLVVLIFAYTMSGILYILPGFTMHRIIQLRALGDNRVEHIIATILSCSMWTMSASLGGADLRLLIINCIGSGSHILYLIVCYIFGNPQQRVQMKVYIVVTCVLLGIAAAPTFSVQENRAKVIAGCFSSLYGILMYSSLILALKELISLPLALPLAISSLLNGVFWFIHGLLAGNIFGMVADGSGVLSGLLQIVLYARSTANEEQTNA